MQIRDLAEGSIGLDRRAAGFALQQTIHLIQNLESEIAFLYNKIRTITDEIDSPVMSVPGIGYTHGAIILAETGNIENFQNPGKLLKFAGLELTVYESGKFKTCITPMVKRGSTCLRRAYKRLNLLPAVMKFSASIGTRNCLRVSTSLLQKAMLQKKLIRVVFHLLKTNTQFEQTLGFAVYSFLSNSAY